MMRMVWLQSMALASVLMVQQEAQLMMSNAFVLPQQRTPFGSFSSSKPKIQPRFQRAPNAIVLKMSSGGVPDFYKVLGIPRDATKEQVEEGYNRMSKIYDPAVTKNEGKDTTQLFKLIKRAYEVLSDDEQRKQYDAFDQNQEKKSAPPTKEEEEELRPFGVNEEENTRGGRMGAGGADMMDPFGAFGGSDAFGQEVDLSDIFDTFFGGTGSSSARARARRGPSAGDDLRFDLEIDFKTAVFGGEEKVRIRHAEVCETCEGTGVKPGAKIQDCSQCQGRGFIVQMTRTPLGSFQTQQTCPSCRGSGQEVTEYCSTCGGDGLTQKTKQIKVTIPPGVENGNKLRVRGEGDAGKNGGASGDLYIFLKVKSDENFKRDGSEIYSEETVSYLDALLGGSVKTPVVDGEVTMKVPPGTQPGQVMRLKGNGAPRLGNPSQRGDHFVTLKVEIPKNLSSEEKDLIEQLKALQDKKSGFFSKLK